MEAPVERDVSDAIPETRLHLACLFHRHVAVVLVARQDAPVEDEARGVCGLPNRLVWAWISTFPVLPRREGTVDSMLLSSMPR